jgi:hypothetical protein
MTFTPLGALANKIVDDAAIDQLDLFGLGTPEKPSNPIEAAFWQFHSENPRVYELFNSFTRQAINRGHKSMSADMILHRIRWETSVETTEDEPRINNNYSAYYGRLWSRNNPDFASLFRTRRLLAGAESDALKVKETT